VLGSRTDRRAAARGDGCLDAIVDLARTIAFILNVRPPNGCEGRVLSEALN